MRRWTAEEDALLRSWPANRPLRELAQQLGRTYLATRNRYHKVVGIRRRARCRPQARSWEGIGSKADASAVRDLLRLAHRIAYLRRARAIRGPLAGPDWVGVLLRAVGEFARRSRRLGQAPSLSEFEGALLSSPPPRGPRYRRR